MIRNMGYFLGFHVVAPTTSSSGTSRPVQRRLPLLQIQIVILSAQLMLRSLVLMLTREKPLPGQLGLPYAQAKALVALGRRDKRP
ncbi:hypothetical protein RAH32_21430, partial [Paracoccus sp. WLY502]|uniref:hypothetical protein n=1 Tax=Paracoccus yibinensis TaxID=3068891 RepID=UPI0027966344